MTIAIGLTYIRLRRISDHAHVHRAAPFAAVRDKYLGDEEFAALQQYLAAHPDAGDVIPGTGGCRKVRWAATGHGRRGGVRVIYFLRLASGQIVLVTMYSKGVRENIDPRVLRRLKEGFTRG